MARKLQVEIVGDSRSLERAFGRSAGAATGFGRSMSRMGRTVKLAALGAGVAITGGLIATLKRGFDELSESQKVSAQTAAAIKSTGAAAHVTAGQVAELAGALSRKTGIDDEAIQAGENLLLTFKNVRNEVGKGNDVFNKATQAAVDLSVAGFGSLDSTSKQLGKALNDPIKGMTALGRAGITFSADQKKAIKAMVETGNILGAQKLILKEVESQVGGSAKAYGETLPGQLAKLRNAFDELAGRVATKLLPALTQAVDWVNAHWPQISATIEAVSSAIFTAIGATVGFIRDQVIPAVKTVVDFVRANWPQISATARQVFSEVSAVITGTVTVIRALWSRFGADILASAKATWNQVSGQIKGALEIIRGIVKIVTALLHGDFSKAWDGIKQVFSGALTSIAATLRGMVTVWGTIAKSLGKAILDGVAAGLTALAGLITRELGKLAGVLSRTAGQALSQAAAIGQNIIDGIVNGMAALVQKIKGKLDSLWGIISNVAGLAAGAAVAIGTAIIGGIISGLSGLVGRVSGAIASGVKGAISGAWGALKGSPYVADAVPIGRAITEGVAHGVRTTQQWLGSTLVRELTRALAQTASGVSGAASGIAESIGTGIKAGKGAAVKGLNDVGQAIVAAAKKYGVDARAALAVAMGEGGVKFGAVGDSGTSFGPFQLHIGGASPSSDPKKAAEFANSIRGIEYAIRKMAEAGAKGKSGFDAINAIIRNFERPLDPDSSVRNAVARYATIPAAIGSAVTSATPIVQSSIQGQLALIGAAVARYAPTIGLAKARGIVAGFLQAAPTLAQQIKQALATAASEAIAAAAAKVREAKDAFAGAFGELSSAALAAFDANAAKFKSKAREQLEAMQLNEQIRQMKDAILKGQTGLDEANAGLAAALSGGDPEAIKAAQAAVLAAQETFNQAVLAQTQFNLEQKAQRQEAAHAKEVERDRVRFQNRLTHLQNALAQHPKQHDKIQKEILDLLDRYVPGYKIKGEQLGFAIAQGIRNAIGEVKKAFQEMLAAIDDKEVVKKAAKAGQKAASLAVPRGDAGRGPQVAMAGGGTQTIRVEVPINMDGRQVAYVVRDILVRGGQRNDGGMLAGA